MQFSLAQFEDRCWNEFKDLQIFPWPNLFRLYILCIFYPQIMVSFSDEREMSVYRTDGALPKRSVLEKEFIAILGESNQNQKNFQYLVAFDDGLPQSVTFKGESITKYGYNMIISYNYLSWIAVYTIDKKWKSIEKARYTYWENKKEHLILHVLYLQCISPIFDR